MDKSVPWKVEFKESYEEGKIKLYKDPIVIASGDSDLVQFKINGYGDYSIKSGDYVMLSKVIEKNSLFGWLPKWSLLTWIVVLTLVGGGVYFVLSKGKMEKSSSKIPAYEYEIGKQL